MDRGCTNGQTYRIRKTIQKADQQTHRHIDSEERANRQINKLTDRQIGKTGGQAEADKNLAPPHSLAAPAFVDKIT